VIRSVSVAGNGIIFQGSTVLSMAGMVSTLRCNWLVHGDCSFFFVNTSDGLFWRVMCVALFTWHAIPLLLHRSKLRIHVVYH
jgi:hypothetical protein